MKRALIIDVSAIMYRMHFAMIKLVNNDGKSMGALYGFVVQLNLALKVLKPDYVVACMDVKRSTLERTEAYSLYKANRKTMPEELVAQIEAIKNVLKGYGIPIFSSNGFEADDLIATFANNFTNMNNGSSENKTEVFVLTGDKDLMQLVDPNELIVISLLGKGDNKTAYKYIRTAEEVKEYLGVYPEQVIDFFGLKGDMSDGIPGVKGIGEKTGIKLISEYGNLENIYENIENIKGAVQKKLIENKEMAFLSRELATVKKDIDIDFDLENMQLKTKKYNDLLPLYKEWGLKKFYSELKIEMSEENIKEEKPKEIKIEKTLTQEPIKQEIKKIEKELEVEVVSGKEFVEKINLLENKSFYGDEFGYSATDGKKIYVCLEDLQSKISDEKQMELFSENKINEKVLLEEISEKRMFISYNVKEYIKKAVKIKDFFDVMLAWYILGSGEKQDIENIVLEMYDAILPVIEKKKQYNELSIEDKNKIKVEYLSKRSMYIFRLKNDLTQKMEELKLDKVYNELEKPLVKVLASMELEGIKIDRKYFIEYKEELEFKIENLKKDIYALAGEEFNISSPKQLSYILFEKMGIESMKKTKTGYSTDVEVLEMLSLRGIEIANKMLEYRMYTKLLSTYVEPLIKLADENDRIHTTFNQNGTTTGRLSSQNPNIQNIPARTEEGMKIRRGFIASEGKTLISFDYSQIELRVLTELSKDENLIEVYKEDKDLHDMTARKLFLLKDSEEVTKEQRNIAKTINFSVLYGKTPFGLSKELKIPISDASFYIDTYFEKYPKVREFLDDVIKDVEEKGYADTFYGSRRYFPNINSSNKNIKAQMNRMAINSVVQGTAANIIKKVMIEIYKKICNDDLKLLLQVHDELIFEVSDSKVEDSMKKIKDIMENTIKFKDVKIKAHGNYGKKWSELK